MAVSHVSLLSVVSIFDGDQFKCMLYIWITGGARVHFKSSSYRRFKSMTLMRFMSQSHCGNEWILPRGIFNVSIDHFSFHISKCLFFFFQILIIMSIRALCTLPLNVHYLALFICPNRKLKINKNEQQIDKCVMCDYIRIWSVQCSAFNTWRTNWIVSMPNALLFSVCFEYWEITQNKIIAYRSHFTFDSALCGYCVSLKRSILKSLNK